MSGAPIISGSTKLASPANTGMTNRKIEQRGVDREHAVVLLGGQELHPRLGQLGADQHRQQAADEQEEERGDRVLDPDHLVVGVDAEVVAPAVGAVRGVVLGPGGLARRPVEPVVARPRGRQEEQRHGDQRDDRDRVAVDDRVVVHQRQRTSTVSPNAKPKPSTSNSGRAVPAGTRAASAESPSAVLLRRIGRARHAVELRFEDYVTPRRRSLGPSPIRRAGWRLAGTGVPIGGGPAGLLGGEPRVEGRAG